MMKTTLAQMVLIAGVAAALSIRQNVLALQVDIKTLQAELRACGGILSEEDIAKANTPTAVAAEVLNNLQS